MPKEFIVHFIVICTIVCVVGLAVPPFFGIIYDSMRLYPNYMVNDIDVANLSSIWM